MLRKLLTTLMIAGIVAMLASCSTGTLNVGDGNPERNFSVVRYGDSGSADPALAATVTVTANPVGNGTEVILSVEDTEPMYGVTLDLLYDTALYTPEKVEFSGLIDTPVELAYTGTSGIVNAGQVSLDGEMARTGEFARVLFVNSPNRSASAAGDAHPGPINVVYEPAQITAGTGCRGFELLVSHATEEQDVQYRIYDCFMNTDGDSNGSTTIGDLTPLISYGFWGASKAISDTSYGTARTDYSMDGETNISDLTPMASVLNLSTSQIQILIGDSNSLTSADLYDTLYWLPGDGQHGSEPYSTPPPAATANWDNVFRRWEGSITHEELKNIDVNNDLNVFMTARLSNGTTPTEAFAARTITIEDDTPPVEVPTSISSIGFTAPDGSTNVGWTTATDSTYVVLITEKSVGVDISQETPADPSEDFAPGYLDLVVMGRTNLNPDTDVDITDLMHYVLTAGEGLAEVSNASDTRGRLGFTDRGAIEVTCHAIGDLDVIDTIPFYLASIESIDLTLTAGDPGPTTVAAGTAVSLFAVGTFDWDTDNTNADEITNIDLTGAAGWGALVSPGGTPWSIDTGTGVLDTTGASGGEIRVTCEFPSTDTVTIYDNVKRTSNFVVVNVT